MEQQTGKISLPPNFLQQFRQLSIPLWVRGAVLVLVMAVFFADVGVLVFSFLNKEDKWLQTAGTVFGATFVPMLVVVYLAFAETGVSALRKKTQELLEVTVPKSLAEMRGVLQSDGFGDEIDIVIDQVLRNGDSSSKRYCVSIQSASDRNVLSEMIFSLDINVSKANVGLWFPSNHFGSSEESILSLLQQLLAHTLEGARREGYEFNENPGRIHCDGRDYHCLVAIKRLPADFLWDPGHKLYFAQDLRFFIASALIEGKSLFKIGK